MRGTADRRCVRANGRSLCRPVRTFTIKELVAASGYPERSIRHYVQEGFLPRTEYRGKDTLYGDVHHTALRAITKLRREQKMYRLAPLRAWFAGKTPAEIESFVTGVPIAPPAPEPEPAPAAPEPPPEPPRAEMSAGERWV